MNTLGWYDFLNNNPVGKTFSKVATSAIDGVDKTVQKGFSKADKVVDSFDKKGQSLGSAIDNMGNTYKSVKNSGLNRNDLDDIHENKKILDENLPTFIKNSKPYQTTSKVVETSNNITKVADKINGLQK